MIDLVSVKFGFGARPQLFKLPPFSAVRIGDIVVAADVDTEGNAKYNAGVVDAVLTSRDENGAEATMLLGLLGEDEIPSLLGTVREAVWN